MADSPRCFDCIKKGLTGQMYKIAGKPKFKCRDCGWIGARDKFEPIEFEWKLQSEAYWAHLESKGIRQPNVN